MNNQLFFSEIGLVKYCTHNNIINLKLNTGIKIENCKFIFIKLDSQFIPFKILSVKKINKYTEITTKNTDTICKNLKNLKVFLENSEFNNSVNDNSRINIIDYLVLGNNNKICGKVINLYKNNGNTYLEIEHNSKIITLFKNNKIIKKTDNINKTITITDEDIYL